MKSNAPWSVKGIERDAREIAKAAAQREGLTLGEWLNQKILTVGEPNAPPVQVGIDSIRTRDLAAAIELLSRRIAGAEAKSTSAIEALARSLGGAVERLQRLERGEPGEGESEAFAARLAALEERTAGQQRIEALRALEKAVAQVSIQFNAAQQSTVARLDAAERRLQLLVERTGGHPDQVSAAAIREAIEGMAARVARAEKIAADAAQLKSAAAESADSDFVQKTGIRLRILGDEIKRGGDQMRALEATIGRLSQQIDAAEKRSAEGVNKVAETIADLRVQFEKADAADQGSARAEIDAAVLEIEQRAEDRIRTLQESFESMARRLDDAPGSAPMPRVAAATTPRPSPEELDLDSEIDDAFAALDLEEPITTPTTHAAPAADDDDEFGFPTEAEEGSVDRETEDVLAEIREAFGIDAPAQRVEPQSPGAAPAPEAPAVEPPPIAAAPSPEIAKQEPSEDDYLKAARRAAREAAAKAAAEEQPSGRRKLTPKQRAILAARIKKRKLEEATKAAETAATAAPKQAEETEESKEDERISVKARVAALVAKIKSRAEKREDEANLDAPAEEPAQTSAPNLLAGATAALNKLKAIPNAGGVFALAAAIVLLLGASFVLFKDMFGGKPKREQQAVEAPAKPPAADRIEPAAQAAATVRPRELYLANIAALKTAETDAVARNALASIEQAATLGHPPAQLQIGELYKLGQLYERDLASARVWFERAANGGNVLAMHRLGVMAARGEGGPVDPGASIAWFEKAAGLGLVDSQYNLGATYHPTADGAAGGVQDRGKAYFWYSVAAKNGDAQAGELAAGLAATMPAAERSAKDAEVAAWAAKTPDPLANELSPAS